jgi:Peptidase family C25/Propeptide_C25
MIRGMHKISAIVVLVVSLHCAAVVEAGVPRRALDDLTVVSSDARSIVITFSPRYLTPGTFTEQGTEYTLIDFENALQGENARQAGAPDVRFRYVPLGFPGRTGTSVRVIAADYEDVRNVTLAPVPTHVNEDNFVDVESYSPSIEAYGRSSFTPQEVVQMDGPHRSGDRMIGGVRVYPVQFNPSARSIRKYSRIVVEIVYGPRETGRVRPRVDQALDNVLLNYDAARTWFLPPSPAGVRAAGPSILSTGEWYKLAVNEEGIYKLDRQYLASIGLNVGSIDPRQIRIYGNGGKILSEDPFAPRPEDLVENAIYVEGEADGTFGDADFVLFYAKATRGVEYNGFARQLEHYINIYTETNYYWLTVGPGQGKRMQTQESLAASPDVVPDRFLDAVFTDQEKVNLLGSGKEWYDQPLLPNGSFTYVTPLPGYQAGSDLTYRYALVSRSSITPTFVVREGAAQVGVHSFLTVNYSADGVYAQRSVFTRSGSFPITNNTSQMNFQFNSASAGASGWVDWFEIQYRRSFEGVNNYLRFRSPDTTGIVEYHLTQFSAAPRVFNVSVPEDVRIIPAPDMTLRDSAFSGRTLEYCAAGSEAYKAPAGAERIQNQDLRGYHLTVADSGADFIIVTSREFRSVAQRLKQFREQPAHGNLRTLIADVDLIYNEFGGGLPDITAIRDFLKYAYDNWPRPPAFVLMLGGTSFDYKGILGSRSSFVPIWQSQESTDDVKSYSTDDYFVKFGSRQTITIGRISSRQPSEATILIDKLIRYEDASAADTWASRMIFVADDGWTPSGDEYALHSSQSEFLANNLTPDEFDKKKIYIAEYPTVQTAQGRRKPGAYQAIIDEINRGALVVNFTGHGNPTVWAHENVFNVQTSIPQLVNSDRLFLFFGATCNFSQYDDPKRLTGSELMLNKPDGGAIAVVSALRKVYAGQNATLHQRIFAQMFRRDSFNRLVVERPATAIYLMKAAGGSGDPVNDAKYVFLGDPTMRLRFPSGYASIDRINQHALSDSEPAQLQALAKVTVEGSIRDQNNIVDSTFNGTARLVVNDATRQVTIVDFSPNFNWTYLSAGGTVYRGENSVVNGRFSATFVVPKDISYADSTTRARLVASFSNGSSDGLGFTDNVRVGGTDAGAPVDETGPTMSIFLGNRSFRPGDLVAENPLLIVDITDSSGINTSVTGIGHRIEARINNSPETIDLTDFYTSKLDNYREGSVQYELKGVGEGKNYVEIRAWDTYNNSSIAQTYFQVSSSSALAVTDVFNYPNPFAASTTFTFRQNQLSPVDVMVKIYTLAGRLIQTLETVSAGESFIRIPWDGRDRDGDILANGVYLYKLVVRTTDGRYSSEALGKLSVLK